MTGLRRFLVLIALMFWQGGFTFYVSVVVPVATEVLGSPLRQGFITRPVTWWLNVIASIALTILLWDTLGCKDAIRFRKWSRLGLWLAMAIIQGCLFGLHGTLSAMMVEKGRIVSDPDRFYVIHRIYLWLHTAQWLGNLLWMGLMLAAWRKEDRTPQE